MNSLPKHVALIWLLMSLLLLPVFNAFAHQAMTDMSDQSAQVNEQYVNVLDMEPGKTHCKNTSDCCSNACSQCGDCHDSVAAIFPTHFKVPSFVDIILAIQLNPLDGISTDAAFRPPVITHA